MKLTYVDMFSTVTSGLTQQEAKGEKLAIGPLWTLFLPLCGHKLTYT